MAEYPPSQDQFYNSDLAVSYNYHPLYPTIQQVSYPAATEGQSVRLFCRARPLLYLTGYEDGSVGMSPINVADTHQKWIIDKSWGLKLEDVAGFPAFAIINKATGRALRHGHSEYDQVDSVPYRKDEYEDDVLWSTSQDFGQGYRTIRMYNNIALNLDAALDQGGKKKKHGGVLNYGAGVLILQKWIKNRDNQFWRIVPS